MDLAEIKQVSISDLHSFLDCDHTSFTTLNVSTKHIASTNRITVSLTKNSARSFYLNKPKTALAEKNNSLERNLADDCLTDARNCQFFQLFNSKEKKLYTRFLDKVESNFESQTNQNFLRTDNDINNLRNEVHAWQQRWEEQSQIPTEAEEELTNLRKQLQEQEDKAAQLQAELKNFSEEVKTRALAKQKDWEQFRQKADKFTAYILYVIIILAIAFLYKAVRKFFANLFSWTKKENDKELAKVKKQIEIMALELQAQELEQQAKSQKKRGKEYSSYEEILTDKQKQNQARFQQLQLLKNYRGCKTCGSLEVDAYTLYQENKLLCYPCLLKKESGASSPISFAEQQKWFKKHWKINLSEWLANFSQLPVNKKCAEKWLKAKQHLNNCDCLARETKEIYLLFTNSLKRFKTQLKDCKCQVSRKIRITYTDNHGNGWTYCEICQQRIDSVGHHGIIRNRNSPKFWGLITSQKILCGNCLSSQKETMPPLRKAEFNRYRKVGRL